MNHESLPEDPAKQWEVLLCIIAFEEKKLDRRPEGAFETLTYIFNHKGIRHIFTEWLRQMMLRYDTQLPDDDTPHKNDEISLLWRQRGNVKFKAELFEESYELFTKSVLYARKESPMYSMALANRSAASLRLKRYKESLRDVQRALNHKYPPDLQHKLYLRRADCFFEMGQRQDCIEAMRLAVKHNEKVKLQGISKAEFDRTYGSLVDKLRTLENDDVAQTDTDLPELFMGENPEFMNASNAVQLVRNEKYGRHVLCKEPLNRGDVVFSEEPFASVKLAEKDLPHPFFCDCCCSADKALIGCNDCSRVMYCDEACFYLGKTYYHRWECAGVRGNIFPLIGIAHLAFRVMLTYAQKGFPRLPPNVPIPQTAAALMSAYSRVDNVAVYRKEYEPFYSMFNLQSNFETTSVSTDKIQYALSSTMLTLYLENYTNFFDYFSARVGYPLPMSEMKLLCAGLMFRTLGQLVTNAHTVMELNTGPIREIPSCCQETRITNPWRSVGTGVYPTASMMNHSCEPNVISLFYKNHLYVKVIRELPKDEEILNCYGPHYARQSTAERREVLRTQYGFKCECPACLDHARKDFVSLFSAYACWSCKGPVTWEGTRMSCHACTNDFPLQKAQNAAETAESMHVVAMRCTTKENRCDQMLRSYRLMQQVLYRHHNALRKASDDLALLYAAIGDYTKCMDLIRQNIQSFEYQYGSFSVEVTNEIRKMSNLMLGRVIKYLDCPEQDERQPMPIKDWIRETLKIVRKASQLMELNFGTWQPIYKVLRHNERVLDGLLTGPHFQDHAECGLQIHYISYM